MPKPISTTLGMCLLSCTVAQGGVRGSSAVSSEAQAIRQAVSALAERAEQSQALFGEKAAALTQLYQLAADCAQTDWDGSGANEIEPLAVWYAEEFIRALPDFIPLPEFTAEPDGSVSLDWICSRNRMFSISVGKDPRLAYAWLDGTDKGHAVAGFDGDRIPQRILQGITAIINHGTTTLGLA